MLKQIDFSFAKSYIAVNACSRPDEEAIRHLLAPQPYIMKHSSIVKNPQSSMISQGHSKSQYVDFTLGNSPEYSNTIQPQKQVHAVSSFHQKMPTSSKKYGNKFSQPQKEIKIIKKPQSKSKEPLPIKKNQHLLVPPKQSHFQMGESKTEREEREENSRGSRAINNSIARECNAFHNQSTLRNPRQDSIYIGDKVKQKFTNKSYQIAKSQSPDKLALINKIEELKAKIGESQNLNKTLGMHLQTSREKLKSKQAENSVLRGKFDELSLFCEQSKQFEMKYKQLERELLEQKKMNDYFCDEIDKQKDEVVKYEYKNEESLRLLQKLNENITKREEKLQRELSQQIGAYSKLTSEKNDVEFKLKASLEQINRLQGINVQFEQKNDEVQKNYESFKAEILQRDEQLQTFKEKECGLNAELKASKDEINNLKSSFNEISSQKQKLLIELGKNQEQITSLKQKTEDLSTKNTHLTSTNQTNMNDLNNSLEQKLNELKSKIQERENQIESLYYTNKEYEMKLEIMNETNDQNIIELKDLKQEKRILYLEKEELKNDLKQLLDKNDQLFASLEANKRKELELNNNIFDQQKQIIALEERISQNIADIANKDMEVRTLNGQIEQQKSLNTEYSKSIEQKNTKISQLEERMKKYEKMLSIYKEEVNKIKDNKEAQWQQMKSVYEQQICILEEKLKEFAQLKDNKKNLRTIQRKTVIHQQSSIAVHRVSIQDHQHEIEEENVVDISE